VSSAWTRLAPEDEESGGRDERESGADQERGLRTEEFPPQAEEDGRRKRGDPDRAVEDTEGSAAQISLGEIRDQRPLGPLGRGEKEGVEAEEAPRRRRARRESESDVGRRVDRPPRDDHRRPPDPVRQGAERDAEQGLGPVEGGPEQG